MLSPLLDKILVVIPARAGSKGVPNKNSKSFAGGDSLVERTIKVAQELFTNSQIIVSSDDDEVLEFAQKAEVIASKRPSELATDTSGMQEVLLHCIAEYGAGFKYLMLLQPTCPFRTLDLINRCVASLEKTDDAVVGMNEAKAHPEFTLFTQQGEFVSQYGAKSATRRQDTSKLLEVNGSIYLLKISSLLQSVWTKFDRVRPVISTKLEAFDIDTPEDWKMAEMIANGMNAKKAK